MCIYNIYIVYIYRERLYFPRVCVCVCVRARPLETCHSYMFDRSCQKPTSDLGTLPSQSQGWGAHGMSERS